MMLVMQYVRYKSVCRRAALDLGAPRIPTVRWADVGGLEHVKKAITDTIELPLRFRCVLAFSANHVAHVRGPARIAAPQSQ